MVTLSAFVGETPRFVRLQQRMHLLVYLKFGPPSASILLTQRTGAFGTNRMLDRATVRHPTAGLSVWGPWSANRLGVTQIRSIQGRVSGHGDPIAAPEIVDFYALQKQLIGTGHFQFPVHDIARP